MAKNDIFKKAYNYQFVSIPVLAFQQAYYFPDLPNLRKAKIQRMHVYFKNVLNKDINGVGTVNWINAIGFYLTLVRGNEEIISKLDLGQLSPFLVKSTPMKYGEELYFDNLEIDFSKSKVETAANFFSVTTCLCFGIFYIK